MGTAHFDLCYDADLGPVRSMLPIVFTGVIKSRTIGMKGTIVDIEKTS